MRTTIINEPTPEEVQATEACIELIKGQIEELEARRARLIVAANELHKIKDSTIDPPFREDFDIVMRGGR